MKKMTGKRFELLAQELFSTTRQCCRCMRRHNEIKNENWEMKAHKRRESARWKVIPVLIGDNLEWGCEKCFPPAKEPKEDKKLIAQLQVPMFNA